MSTIARCSLAAVFLCRLVLALPHAALALTTGFTYQGELQDQALPAAGQYDLRFKLFTALSGGSQVGATIDRSDVLVTDGLFTVVLDLGASPFTGKDRWLEVAVRPGASSDAVDFVTLSPRQPLTPVPYSLHTRGIVVDDDYDVGMGTDAPELNLDVRRFVVDPLGTATSVMGATSQVRDVLGPPLGEQWVYLRCDANRFSNADVSLVRNAGAALQIGTNSLIGEALTEQLTITADGRVGIGTSSPSAALDVAGYAKVSRSVEIGGSLGVGMQPPAKGLQVTGGTDSDPSGGGYLVLGPTSADNLSLDTNEIMARYNGAAATLYLNHNGGTVAIGAADPAGSKLGLGTSSPAERLDLGGGNIAMGYEIVDANTCTSTAVAAYCPAGKRVIGGGCRPGGNWPIVLSHPAGTSGWNCTFDTEADCPDGDPNRAYAICANIR